jgi:hypothetical protein
MNTAWRPFVYGSHAALIKGEIPSDPSHTHIWTIYVRGLNGEDQSYFIDKVEFKLHESFKNPKRGILLFTSYFQTTLSSKGNWMGRIWNPNNDTFYRQYFCYRHSYAAVIPQRWK